MERLKWRYWLIMNRRGQIGTLISMFVTIIIVAIILIGFVILAGPWNKFSEKPVGVLSFGNESEAKGLFDYVSSDYEDLMKIKFGVAKGEGVSEAMQEAGYEG